MSARRARSLGCMQDQCFIEYTLAEGSTEESGCVEIHALPNDDGNLVLQIEEFPTRSVAVLELNKDINIAVRPEVFSQHGAKEGESPDMVSPTEAGDTLLIDRDLDRHLTVALLDRALGSLLSPCDALS